MSPSCCPCSSRRSPSRSSSGEALAPPTGSGPPPAPTERSHPRGAQGAGRGRHDDGQATPLVALLVLLACGAVLLIAHLGHAADARARAQTAADAAALAGAVDGEEAARATAEANGAEVEVVRREGGDAWVRVRVGRATAEARARARWTP